MAEWQNDVTKGGCIRKIGLNCGSNGTDQDRFRLIPRIKFPVAVDAKFLNASSRGECESSCLRSCSCTAYTFIAGTCQLWYGNLKNTRVIENDTDGTGGDLYLRLSASEFGLDSSPGFSTWMILVIVAASSVLGSLVLVSCICYCLRRRKERVRTRQEKSILTWGAEIASKLREQGATGPDFTLFGFSCIKDATDNFSDEYKLGEGGFGPVYKAWDLWSDGSWLELVDPVINDDTLHALELHRCIHVALLCVQDSACHRPTMSEVIALLGNENDSASLTAPKKPVFFSVSIATQTGDVKSSPSFSNAKQTCSLNHLSLTTMHAR
ncbi:hypothetical protein J5N97_011824 [Dioscorea zingiberensis]|uniref:Apple domain-containing protein n=1 Tax=Dioscorea zingiberensis TaxID=325984 RepID=A0A9D5HNW2_9LILI|nr:hypothetical protein J5N97_011824 [Dioscorea zingiberensis]